MPTNTGCFRIDLHTHTHFSPDSTAGLIDIMKAVRKRGLDAIAVTDHNRIEGALRLREMAPFLVVVGEEIKTAEGEIPALLSPEETVGRIREQGGVVYVPHPFDRVRPSHLARKALMRIIDTVDVVEVINSRTTLPWDNWRAERLAQEHGLLRGAGSDAHIPREIGHAWVELPPFVDAKEFLASMGEGRAIGRLTTPLVHLTTRWVKLRRRLRRER
ncbi:MAG: PHP domain-containing protein [Chloroflexota bacterium]